MIKIRKLVGPLQGKTVAVLGLAFKPETDDMREAPAVGIIQNLIADGANVRAYDPVAKAEAMKLLPEIMYADDEYAAVKGADALVFITEWNQFRALDMTRIRDLMTTPKSPICEIFMSRKTCGNSVSNTWASAGKNRCH